MRRAGFVLASVLFAMVPVAFVESEARANGGNDAGGADNSADALIGIGQKIRAYTLEHKRFPPAFTVDRGGRPLLSWRVLILPYCDEKLHKQFRLDEPWDSEHNRKLIGKMPPIFALPDSKLAEQGKTNYLAVRGDKTVFPGKTGVALDDVPDGLANTIMTVEVPDQEAVVWTKPDDFQYDEKNPAKGLFSPRSPGFWAGFADGAVRFIPSSTKPTLLVAMFTRNGAEPFDLSDVDPEEAAAKKLQRHKILVISELGENAGHEERHVTSVNFCGASVFGEKKVPDECLEQLAFFPELQSLNVGDCRISSDQLKYLAAARLGKLASLVLSHTAIDDKGLKHLRPLRALESLTLRETAISDAGLDPVAALAELKVLDLSKTKVTDAGVKKLQQLDNLKWLLLAETALTDAGLDDLAPLTNLGRLTINKTNVTPEGIKRLKQAIPRLAVDFDQ